MSELDADTVVILSSELISKIVGEYFNKKMFKDAVEIVDLKPTENGYMFSIAFIEKVKSVGITDSMLTSFNGVYKEETQEPYSIEPVAVSMPVRGSDGRFAKVKE